MKRDWTAQAEVQVIEQTRKGGRITGKFEIKNILTEEESRVLAEILKRMYGWE